MPKRIALTALNARSIDIVNVIRQNASYAYQTSIPEIAYESDLPAVGEALAGAPALQNEFLNALINRIALVKIKSATFNNAYAELKKGVLEYGETVEEVFVQITKARPFSAEKAEQREFKRSLPDVKSAFHIRNWRVQYPVTIQDDDLRTAFLTPNGVSDLIARIVNAVVTASEYDEFLLFKYLLIKAINRGKIYIDNTVSIQSPTDEKIGKALATKFRGMSNKLTFMSNKYNEAGVTTVTPREDQYIFMDSEFNAMFDVNVLASAFNMDKAEFMGHLKLIDDWTTFDNERFAEIVDTSDKMELVTDDELANMAYVKAILVDKEWFQIYDNLTKFTEKYVASGLYWNYFYNIWKTISSSPFSNCVCFTYGSTAVVEHPNKIVLEVVSNSYDGGGENPGQKAITFAAYAGEAGDNGDVSPDYDKPLEGWRLDPNNADTIGAGIAIHPYGALLGPVDISSPFSTTLKLTYQGDEYVSETFEDDTWNSGLKTKDVIVFNEVT